MSDSDYSVPEHLAIIMDGNHRWAESRQLPRDMGHRFGARNLRPVAEACADEGVKYLSLFAFSTENWNRPKAEVDLLLTLIRQTLIRDVQALNERDARLLFVGDRTRFSLDLQHLLAKSERETAHNKTLTVAIALNYGGRWDLVEASKQLLIAAQRGEVDPYQLDEETFARYLSTADLPAPDLCIRTGGDQRISNFLLWDLAYTELYFTDTYWPDFNREQLRQAFRAFTARERRFGRREVNNIMRIRH